ncbi:MAG: hypothetical protein OXH11_09080 [Candidatus Aminicenantes bacterium]|nr:hypothetical protein [Candidatus Aminicenantes bacterium]
MKVPLIYGFVFSAFLAPLHSQDAPGGVQRYLERLSGYRFHLLEKSGGLERAAGDFSRPVLEEYALQSYSRWRLQGSGDSSLVMEVHETLHQQGAFGLYRLDSLLRPGTRDRLELPVENRYREGSCIFWRGPFLFRLTARAGPQARDRLKAAVAALVEAIPIVNLHPVTVLHLPRQDLVTESVGIYLGPAALAYNDRFPDPLMDKIGFQDRVEVAFADYGPEVGSLFLLAYPTPSVAADYFLELQNSLHSFFSPDGIYIKRSGLLLAVFLGTESRAQAVLGEVQWAPAVKWVHDRTVQVEPAGEARSFLDMLLRTALATVCFIVGSLGFGCLLGYIWHRIDERFPVWSSRNDAIHLNLSGAAPTRDRVEGPSWPGFRKS